MKCVMISIQPKCVEKILSGEKKIEVRKTKPNIERPFKCYIYCTKGKTELPVERKINRELEDLCDRYEILYWANGKVIGEFICDKINEYPFSWEDFTAYGIKRYRGLERHRKEMCLSLREIEEYACKNGHAEKLYGLHISDLKIYDQPKELSEFWTIKCNNKKVKSCGDCETKHCYKTITRPPQSWFYVEVE